MGTLIFGSKQFSDLSFVASGKLLNHLFSFIRSRFSEKENLKITFFTNFHREMDIFVEELNSQMDSGYTTLLSTKDLDQNSDKKIPITWIKMKIAHEVNGKLIFGVRSYSQTDSVVLKVTFDEVKLSAKEILLNYNDAMQKSQLYALQDPIDLL